MESVYHFEGVSAVQPSEDGEHILLTTTGADGSAVLSLPAADIPRAVIALLQAGAAATKLRGGKITHRGTYLYELRLQDIPGSPSDTLLLLSIQPDAPPVAYRLQKAEMAGFAQATLQTMGLLPSDQPPGARQ